VAEPNIRTGSSHQASPSHGQPALTLQRLSYPAAASVVARSGQAEEAARRLTSRTGLAIAGGPNRVSNEDFMVWGMAPGRWLVFGKRDHPDWPTFLQMGVDGSASVFDQSSSSAMWRLSGEAAGMLLQKGFFVDLGPTSFPTGSCCTGLVAQIAVTAARVSDSSWEIAVPRSYGGYFLHWLQTASANVGYPLHEAGEDSHSRGPVNQVAAA
jgi:sarcosine oxidase subunit gamma